MQTPSSAVNVAKRLLKFVRLVKQRTITQTSIVANVDKNYNVLFFSDKRGRIFRPRFLYPYLCPYFGGIFVHGMALFAFFMILY
jgi:hypothetical protein